MGELQAPATAVRIQTIEENIGRVFLGKPEAIRLVVVGLLADGHVLIEDVPGVGKTILAKAMARSIHAAFQRIQFTADLLPSDITGVSIYESDRKAFVFQPGPIFANIVLADEINRSTPRTQSSLLECMNERAVSVDRITHKLPAPFMVLATQNPFEYEGTFPLPESELDRFTLHITIGYPSRDMEAEILQRQLTPRTVDSLAPVVDADEVVQLQDQMAAVRIEASLLDYLLAIVARTRTRDDLTMGVSPRGALMLSRSCRALALTEGRDYCLPDDVKRLVKPVLAHRLTPRGGGGQNIGGRTEVEHILDEILAETPVPV